MATTTTSDERINSIHSIMETLLPYKNCNWYAFVKNINKDGSPHIEEFKQILVQFNEKELRDIYKSLRTLPPTILFKEIAKEFSIYYKTKTNQPTFKVQAKMDIDIVIELLAYTLVIESSVNDYYDRINRRFGWVKE